MNVPKLTLRHLKTMTLMKGNSLNIPDTAPVITSGVSNNELMEFPGMELQAHLSDQIYNLL